jgi:hypothetical protein
METLSRKKDRPGNPVPPQLSFAGSYNTFITEQKYWYGCSALNPFFSARYHLYQRKARYASQLWMSLPHRPQPCRMLRLQGRVTVKERRTHVPESLFPPLREQLMVHSFLRWLVPPCPRLSLDTCSNSSPLSGALVTSRCSSI